MEFLATPCSWCLEQCQCAWTKMIVYAFALWSLIEQSLDILQWFHCDFFSPLQWIDQSLIKAATEQSLNGRNFRMLGKNEGQIHFQSYSSIQDPHWALSYSPSTIAIQGLHYYILCHGANCPDWMWIKNHQLAEQFGVKYHCSERSWKSIAKKGGLF